MRHADIRSASKKHHHGPSPSGVEIRGMVFSCTETAARLGTPRPSGLLLVCRPCGPGVKGRKGLCLLAANPAGNRCRREQLCSFTSCRMCRAMSLASGTRLGPYEILTLLGAGGMGEVYRARDTRLERTVAIKVLAHNVEGRAELFQRFEREAQTISTLNHPNICTLHDIGTQDGLPYLVMEYIEGETLSKRLMRGPFPFDQMWSIAIQIGEALDQAHRHGIVHRDLKPGNVMLAGKEGSTTVKLLDFGLAKLSSAARSAQAPASATSLPTVTVDQGLTVEGTIVGTVQYMSPEQLEDAEADARSDIFAFGCVLYEMITGQQA